MSLASAKPSQSLFGLYQRQTVRLLLSSAVAAGLVLGSPVATTHAATTINVTTTADELNNNGKCSLREAVQAANTDKKVDSCPAGSGTDTINLSSGTYKLTLPPDPGSSAVGLRITAGLNIKGKGASATILDGNRTETNYGTRVFDITNNATLTVDRITARNGSDAGGDDGGVIKVWDGAKLTLRNSLVERGSSSAGGNIYVDQNATLDVSSTTIQGSGSEFGGGIYNLGTATLSSVTIRNSSAVIGGAIRNSGTMTIKGGSISNNSSSDSGGGVYNSGSLTIQDSAILSFNTADAESEGSGAAIYNRGTLTIAYATFEGNEADYGGAIYNSDKGTIAVRRTTFKRNTSTGDGPSYGGAIANYGKATITDSTIRENVSRNGRGYGGGVYNRGSMTISGSTINNNQALNFFESPELLAAGGGIANTGSLSIANSTISSNSSDDFGGGLYNGNLGYLTGEVITYLNNVTIANNTADANKSGLGDGGGIYNADYNSGHRIRFSNSIIANNSDTGAQAPDIGGQVSSYGYNLVRSLSGGTIRNSQTGNKYNVDPKLGSLASNGGPTKTQALNTGSPAIDAGNTAKAGSGNYSCEAIDQRSSKRPNGSGSGRCDIGAYEKTSSATQDVPTDETTDAGLQSPATDLSDATANEQAGISQP